jgi:hypothetical protein
LVVFYDVTVKQAFLSFISSSFCFCFEKKKNNNKPKERF